MILEYRLRSMKATATLIALLLVGSVSASAQKIKKAQFKLEKKADGTVIIDNFENDTVGQLPKEWYNRNGERRPITYPPKERNTYKYVVKKENGNQYLHFASSAAKHLNYPLINKDVDIYQTPVLTWKWRVFKVPEGANEDDNSTNDTAASIYVVFDMGHVLFKKVPKSIRYTWSSTLEKGTHLSKLFGNQHIVVMESGTDDTGKWITFQRNIVEDYRRFFGDDPPAKPLAILILSDGDSTGKESIADYDDIKLLPASLARGTASEKND